MRYGLLLVLLLKFGGLMAQNAPLADARWISPGYAEPLLKRPCVEFQKIFDSPKQVSRANLYITALGVYEASINGKRVGRACFTPGFTNYDKRLQYQQYEVTALLKQHNEMKVTVGEGWYRGPFRSLSSDSLGNNFGREAGLLLELDLVYADGSRRRLVSDGSWKSAESFIRYSELYDGEMQDTRFKGSGPKAVKILSHAKNTLIPTLSETVTRHELFKPKAIRTNKRGETLIDFGQNLAGWVKLWIKGRAGDTLRIEHGEMPDSTGDLYTGNLRNAKATDMYILNGKYQVLEPHFTYHGFRYARLRWTRNGHLVSARKANFRAEAVALYTDLPRTGTFSCSNPLLNRLQRNIEWSMKSNFFDIPTDCPQRSERLGWLGDAQEFCGTASFLADTRRFYAKWLLDLASEQGENGGLPNFVPTSSPYEKQRYGVSGWGDAAVMIPWQLYQVYGDTAILRQQYISMKGWVDYMQRASRKGLFLNHGYGDWYSPGDSTAVPMINQCFKTWSTGLLVKTAEVLGKAEDAKYYTVIYAQSLAAFRETYGRFDSRAGSTQTAYVLALAFDLLPEERRPAIAAMLAEKIKQNGNRLATGFLGTPYLLPVLSRFGYEQLAYALLLQRRCPSWLYPLSKGATTMWEHWDAVMENGHLQETSFNHYGYGAVGSWMYEHIAGISAGEPGFRQLRIAPTVGGGLTWAKGSYRTDLGTIRSSWRRTGTKVLMTVEIPQGSSAVVEIPGATTKHIGPGLYHFIGRLNNKGTKR